MSWSLIYLDEFSGWLAQLETEDQELHDEALAHLNLLRERGPLLARPYADTLQGSKLPNLKELRFSHNGAPIRILFAFDPKKQGEIILGGDKTGDKRWYDTNIPIAEKLYVQYLEKQKKEDEEKSKLEKEQAKQKEKQKSQQRPKREKRK